MTKNLIAYAKKYLARVCIMPCAPVETSLLPISGHMVLHYMSIHHTWGCSAVHQYWLVANLLSITVVAVCWWSGAHYWPPEAAVCTYILLLPVSVRAWLIHAHCRLGGAQWWWLAPVIQPIGVKDRSLRQVQQADGETPTFFSLFLRVDSQPLLHHL